MAIDALPTTVVGSYPQPDWLVDRDMLLSRLPPRVRAREVWRVPEPFLEQAQDDATLLAVHTGSHESERLRLHARGSQRAVGQARVPNCRRELHGNATEFPVG